MTLVLRLLRMVLAAALIPAGAAVAPMRTEARVTVTVTEQDSGRAVDLKVGEQVVVDLAENSGGGYRWAVDRIDPPLAEAADPVPGAPSGAVGGGGRVAITLTATAPGTASVALKHWRPWDGDRSIVARFHLVLHILP